MSKQKHLERALAEGRISRRDFAKQMSALGLAAAAPGVLFSGSALAATPKKGGHFRLGLGHGSTTDSLDPGTFENAYSQTMGYGIRNNLTEVSADNELIGELAESWEATPDAKTWRFKLRQGVEFHNGKTLDVNDVIASVQHHRGEDSKSAAKSILEPVVELKADGKDVVQFTLKEGNADFPYIMSDYHIVMMPAKDGKVEWKSGVGTGAFVLESYEPGVSAKMKRNPNYWKEGRGHFDSAEMITIADVAARTNALTTGEIHAMDRVDIKTLHLLKRNKNIKIEESSGNAHYTFAMLTDIAPFDNNDVRLALKWGLDRKALLQTILRGHGYLGNDHPIGRANRYLADDIPQRDIDPDKAKFHLKKAGLSKLTVELSAADAAFAGAVDAAVLYKEHAAKAGIEIKVVREPNDGYWSNVWLKKPWCAVYWGGRPTEDWMFSTAYAEGAPWNDSHWSHPRFNELLALARAELDEPKRREMYREMQLICRDEGGVCVPLFNNYVEGLSTKIGHGKIAGNWTMDGLKALERWWFV